MSWGVDQVEDIVFTVFGVVLDLHRVHLDGNPSLAFQWHVIQHLILQLPL